MELTHFCCYISKQQGLKRWKKIFLKDRKTKLLEAENNKKVD
jgi:hypothetical protein